MEAIEVRKAEADGTWRNIFAEPYSNEKGEGGQITTIVYPLSWLVSTDFWVFPLRPGK